MMPLDLASFEIPAVFLVPISLSFLVFFKTVLAILEHTLQTKLVSSSLKSVCFYSPSAWIKVVLFLQLWSQLYIDVI